MPLKATVKVSHLSNLSDARYCAGMGVHMLGVRAISGGEHFMPANDFQDIRGWIAGPSIVAEIYGVSNLKEIEQVVTTYAPDYIELSLKEYTAFRQALSLPCIVYFPDTAQLADMPPDAKISHAVVDENVACEHIKGVKIPVLVKVRSVDQLNDKLAGFCFAGVVLEAPRESRKGITSYEQLGSLLEALEDGD